MKKKILVVSILAVFMLVAISFSTAVSSNSTDKKRESPLFRVRTRKAIGERLQELKENIKTKFIGDRVFFLSFQWLKNREDQPVRHGLMRAKDPSTEGFYPTCSKWGGWCTIGSNC